MARYPLEWGWDTDPKSDSDNTGSPDSSPATERYPLEWGSHLDPPEPNVPKLPVFTPVMQTLFGGDFFSGGPRLTVASWPDDGPQVAQADQPTTSSARGVAPPTEPSPGSAEFNAATEAAEALDPDELPVVHGPVDALGRWLFGSGRPAQYSMDNIDTSSVRPEHFPAVQEILRRGVPGVYKIEGTRPFWAGSNFGSRKTVGNITLKIGGDLLLREGGNYSFKGQLGALPDRYRMYSSDHRNDPDERDTRFGEKLGSILGHNDYRIHILGTKPIESYGNYAP